LGEGKNHKYSVQCYPAEEEPSISPLLPFFRANFHNRGGLLTGARGYFKAFFDTCFENSPLDLDSGLWTFPAGSG